MKFCLLGTGGAARNIAKALRQISGSEIVAVYGTSAEHTQQFASKNGIKNYYTSLQTLFETETSIEGAIIATIPSRHCEEIITCSTYVDVIIVEKPIVITSKEAELVRTLVQQKSVSISVIYQLRYSKAYQQLKEAIEQNREKIQAVSLEMSIFRDQNYFLGHGAWRREEKLSGGGVLLQQGIHWLNILCSIIGYDIKVMSAKRIYSKGIETENGLDAALLFQKKIPIHLLMSRSSPTSPVNLRVYGEGFCFGLEDFRFYQQFPPSNRIQKWWSILSRKFPLWFHLKLNSRSGTYHDFLNDVIFKNSQGKKESLFLEDGLNDVELILKIYQADQL